MNFKLIGIDKVHRGKIPFNLGIFFKPLIEYFFNNIDLEKKISKIILKMILL